MPSTARSTVSVVGALSIVTGASWWTDRTTANGRDALWSPASRPSPFRSRRNRVYDDALIEGLEDMVLGAFTTASTVIVDPSLNPSVSGTVWPSVTVGIMSMTW